MSTLSSIMNTSMSALQTQQAAIDVTSTNIANANTDGYCRQAVVIETNGGCSTSYAILSSGVKATDVERIHDEFLTRQLISEYEELGYCETRSKYLESVEAVLIESEDYGLNKALSEFWNGWQAVADDPSDSTARSVLASDAKILAETFNGLSSDLRETQKGIDEDLKTTVDEINRLVQEIAGLNQKILQAQASGRNANTYQDSLDSLVLELSKRVDITTYENDNNQTCVQLANGKPLVEGTSTWSLSTRTNASTGLKDVTWVDESGDSTVISGDIAGGELGGMLEVRDKVIPGYQEKLNGLASTLIEQVNALQTSGYDLYGNTGLAFFTGTSAADMEVSASILDDPGTIAAAADADSVPGGGTNAAAIADLQNSFLMNDGTSTFGDFYEALISELGAAVESAESEYRNQEEVVQQYENYRDSVSGVSMDEENANLVLYQNAYEAAAKVISVLDELWEALLDMS